MGEDENETEKNGSGWRVAFEWNTEKVKKKGGEEEKRFQKKERNEERERKSVSKATDWIRKREGKGYKETQGKRKREIVLGNRNVPSQG